MKFYHKFPNKMITPDLKTEDVDWDFIRSQETEHRCLASQ